MEILGIGASELVFILLIAIIILGPKDMQKAGRTIGRWLNQLVRSDGWKVFQKTSTELRNLPRNLMREANMELQDVDKEIKDAGTRLSATRPPDDRPASPTRLHPLQAADTVRSVKRSGAAAPSEPPRRLNPPMQ